MKQVLRLPVYRRLLAAYALNELAWSVGTLALSVLVYRRTGSALGSAVFFLTSMVLPAFAAPFVVARVDQRTPRRLLPVLYAVEGVLFAALAVMTMHFSLIPVLVLTLLDGIVAIVARALARTATTNVLKPLDLLHEGNAIINGAFSICFMAGPAIGGLVVVAGGTVAALLANCGLFVAIALILVTTSGLPDDVPEPEPAKGRLRAALEHVRRRPRPTVAAVPAGRRHDRVHDLDPRRGRVRAAHAARGRRRLRRAAVELGRGRRDRQRRLRPLAAPARAAAARGERRGARRSASR